MFDVETLVSDFVESAWTARLVGWPCGLTTERLPAPHRQPQLKSGNGAVYTFSLSHSYGASVPAGPGRVLKVGKVGARSGPRFYSQHYTLSAPSTLAKSLLRHRILWPWLGVTALDATNVREWMLTSLDRTHFFVPDGRPEVLAALEVFVRARVGSAFEGA